MANFKSDTTIRKMGALLKEGHSVRAVARALKINRGTVLKYAQKLQPEKCVCGKEARHKGWCGPRYLKSSVHKELLAKVHADFVEQPAPKRLPPPSLRSICAEYPYCIGVPGEGNSLLMTVNSAVSKRLPNDARADVCQDLLLAILEGDLNVCDLIPAVQPAIRRRQDMFSVFRTVSLDAPVGFDDAGRPVTLMETIPENYEPIIAKTLRSAPSMT